ncbi:hypothetical protein B1L11_20480 [Microbispora sp. GKU 823]|nr:Ig-like domain-containing protein [Microbispora sp. GKU 823]OPG11394.1 hypothetical protein B1L11_20480 [Microbispora sp. GKU 823]
MVEEAKAKAHNSGKRVEIPERNTETVTLYANPDGRTLHMELSAQPIRVRNADGKGLTPIDTTLAEADGVIKPKAIQGNLVLSAGQDKTLLRSRAAGATAEIAAPSVLPKPKLKGNAAVYSGAYGKGRDLLVTVNPTGFRQQITIAERPTGPVSFKVPVELPEGLSFKKNAAGRPTIVGKDGETLTEVRPTLVQDANAADANAAMGAGKVGKAAVALGEDGKTLVFTPDAAFLADPAVTYPVTMTAAVSDWWEGHTGQSSLGGMDTFVNNADYPDSWDNFLLDRILVGKSNNGAVRWRGYLQFPDIPAEFAGSTVENADLILWNYYSNACGERVGSGITARQITSDWDELTLTWNNQPSVTNTGADTEYGAYSDYNCTGSMAYAWDLIHSVDDIVQAWVDGATNYGIQLTAGSESDVTNWRRYRTDEAGGCKTEPLQNCQGTLHPPILTVDFEPPPPPVVDGFTFMSPDPITSLPTWEEARARSIYEPTGSEQTSISNEFAGQIAGQRDGEAFEVRTSDLDLPAEGSDGDDGSGEDTRPPQVVAVEPANGAVDVPLGTKLKVTFSEPVDEATVVLKDPGGVEVTATMAYDSTNTTVTVTPAQALKPETTYTAVVSGALDSAENTMVPYSWSFTTGGPDTTAPTVTATNPTAGATDVPVTSPVTVTFSEAVTDAQFTLKDPAVRRSRARRPRTPPTRCSRSPPPSRWLRPPRTPPRCPGPRTPRATPWPSRIPGRSPPACSRRRGWWRPTAWTRVRGRVWPTRPATATPGCPPPPPGRTASTARPCRSTARPAGSRSRTPSRCA